jgi:hypothetical protein
MTVFLDEPLPDEALFSVFARYLVEARVGRRMAFLKILTGSGSWLSIGVSHGLDHIAAETSTVWGMTEAEIRDRLTLYPYYASLCGSGARESVEAFSSRRAEWHKIPAPGKLGLRHCESCWKSDRAVGAPRYWRRIHQLPGVITCLKHRQPLNCSGSGASQWLLDTATRFDAGVGINVVGSERQRKARHKFGILCAKVLRGQPDACRYLERSVRIRCARAVGYATDDSVDIARMATDLVAMLGPAYFDLVGIPLHSDRWLRHAFFRSKSEPSGALKYVLLDYLLQDRVDRMAMAGAPVCPSATSIRDGGHRLRAPQIGGQEVHYVCTCGFSFLYASDPMSGARMLRPTHDGFDLLLAAAYLLKRGYSTIRVARHLGMSKRAVEGMLKKQTAFNSWRYQRARARHLAAWIELIDRCGGAGTALASDRGHWRFIAILERSLPNRLIPTNGAPPKKHGDLS